MLEEEVEHLLDKIEHAEYDNFIKNNDDQFRDLSIKCYDLLQQWKSQFENLANDMKNGKLLQ